MHAGRLAQRHAEALIRRSAVLAAAALASCALLASGATASTADTLVVTPATAPISQLQQFHASAGLTATGGAALDVLLNGTFIGRIPVSHTDDRVYGGDVTPQPAG